MVRKMFAGSIKKLKGFILFILLVLSLPLPVRAAQETAQVRLGELLEEEENLYKIPLCITGNQGIMGYYITVRRTSGTACIRGVERGSLTEKGVFDFNVSKEQDTVDILWAGTNEATGDGEIAYIVLSDPSGFRQEYGLTINYSQADTFDEEYQDVKLECYSATIKSEKAGEVPEIISQTRETKQNTQTNSAGNEQVYEEPFGNVNHGALQRQEQIDTQKETTGKIVSQEPGGGTDSLKDAQEGSYAESETIREDKAVRETEKVGQNSLVSSEYKTGDDEIDSKSINIEEKIRKGKTFREDTHEGMSGIIILTFAGIFALITIGKKKGG